MAQRDTSLGENLLTENLTAPVADRYYPEDYSAEIEETGRQGRMLAEIPKSAAQIIENVDEALMSNWAVTAQTDARLNYQERALDLEERERLLELEKVNAIHDMTEQYQSTLNAKLKEGRRTGKKDSAVVAEVNDQFRYPDSFAGASAYEEAWAARFNSMSESAQRDAMRYDLETEEAKAKNNLDRIVDVGCSDIRDGKFTASNFLSAKWESIQEFLQTFPVEARPAIFADMYNKAVLAEADFVITSLSNPDSGMSVDDAISSLTAIKKTYKEMTFDFVDKNGNKVTYADGTPGQVVGYLDSKVLDTLDNQIVSLRGKKNSGYDIDGSVVEVTKQDIDFTTLESTGTCDWIKGKTPDQIKDYFNSKCSYVLKSNAADDKKRATVRELLSMKAQCMAARVAVLYLSESGKIGAADFRKKMDKLDKDLRNPNTDWYNYSIAVGPYVVSGREEKDANPLIGDSETELKEWWRKFAQQGRNTLNTFTEKGDYSVFAASSVNVSQLETDLKNKQTGSQLITKTPDGRFTYNSDGMMGITSDLNKLDKEVAAKGKGYVDYGRGPIKDMLDTSSKFASNGEKMYGAVAQVGGIIKSNHISDLFSYMDVASNDRGRVAIAMAYHLGNQNVARQVLDTAASLEYGDWRTQLEKEGSSIGLDETKQIGAVNDIVKRYGLSQESAGIITQLSSYVAVDAYRRRPGGTVNTYSTYKTYKSNLDELVKSMFVFDAKKVPVELGVNIMKGHPAIKRYTSVNGQVNVDNLKSDLTDYKKSMNYVCAKYNVPGFANGINIAISDKDKQFCYAVNGKPIANRVGGGGIYFNTTGVIFDHPALKDVSAESKGRVAAEAVLLGEIARQGNKSWIYNETKKRLTDRGVANINTLKYTLQNVYNTPNGYTKLVKDYEARRNGGQKNKGYSDTYMQLSRYKRKIKSVFK